MKKIIDENEYGLAFNLKIRWNISTPFCSQKIIYVTYKYSVNKRSGDYGAILTYTFIL